MAKSTARNVTRKSAAAGKTAAARAAEAANLQDASTAADAPAIETVVAQVGERLKAAGVDPERLIEAARDQAGDVQKKVADEVKTNPLRTLGLAAAAGLVVGYLSNR